ncbi:MAG: GC-type dockerin domain-anchored protein [Phycisphaerales bacterium]|nr:GC-type dockerin domain-anchored protein [Phycisphaerales bacterium]
MNRGFRINTLINGSGILAGLGLSAGLAAFAFAGPQTQVPTTLNDFAMPGTQPNSLDHPIASSDSCASCHGFYDDVHSPLSTWSASMMGQSMRDPVFHAALSIANQDAAFAGDLCLRCHTPSGWLEGRSTPTDGSALNEIDMQGVNCNFCHRMVDPVYQPGVSPDVDQAILSALGSDLPTPAQTHSGSFVMDNLDRRRGPYDEGPNFSYHEWEQSPFHQSSSMCATCHDVSNPVFALQPDGTYSLDLASLDAPHPTGNVYETFPVERTYSEWLMSDFAQGPVAIGDRYETTLTEVSSCQDCHMPEANTPACRFEGDRPNYSTHSFNGGNNWVLNAVRNLNDNDFVTGLLPDLVTQSIERAEEMLRDASDMELSMVNDDLNVRIINQTGHKLPTGYPEGRRMWINVQFFDGSDSMIGELGAYDDLTAELTTADTKVYEAKLGLDESVSAATGVPVGPNFHFVLSNKRYKDNRIPPRGFTNANFQSVQAEPIAYSYADGDYWDDTQFVVPAGAARADVRVYYQASSKEYMEFLRDENVNSVGDVNNPSTGEIVYEQWVINGMSPIVEMDFASLMLPAGCPPDLTGDGQLNFFDISAFLSAFSAQDPAADFTGDGLFNFFDISAFLSAFSAGCP